MIDGIEQHYHAIATEILKIAPTNQMLAIVGVEMTEDHESVGLYFRKTDGNYSIFTGDDVLRVAETFRELRAAFIGAQMEPWSTATFRLDPAGKMSLDLGYQDISDLALWFEREQEWRDRELGAGAKIVGAS